MRKLILIILFFETQITFAQSFVTDINGNEYGIVQIGDQLWLDENLKTSRYNNGDTIPFVVDRYNWSILTEGGCCFHEDDTINIGSYGLLYNWYTVQDDRELCPTGWWVPTDNDWSILIDFLGGTQVAGGKIKLTGTDYWEEPNKGATNESGFNALPGGFRSEHGGFYPLGNTGMWWSSTEDEFGEVWFFDSSTGTTNLTKGSFSPNGKNTGISVRCVKNLSSNSVRLKGSEYISVFPNPIIDYLTIKTTDTDRLTVVIVDLSGHVFYENVLNASENIISISHFKSGVYILQLRDNNKLMVRRIFKL